jgi:hypothetical protein
MTPTPSSAQSRRIARNVAIGAVAVTAGVALPAMALDRGGDDTVEAGSANQAPEIPTTTTTLAPEVVAFFEQKAVGESLAAIATLTPEQQFDLQWSTMTDAEREQFQSFVGEQARLAQFYAEQVWIDGVRQAQAARAEAARQEAARQEAARRQTAQRSAAAPAVGRGVWDRLAQCEAGGNWAYPTVSGGFSGGLMFHSGTWNAFGGRAYAPSAHQATREQQIAIAEKVLASQGWGAWPACSRKLGLR